MKNKPNQNNSRREILKIIYKNTCLLRKIDPNEEEKKQLKEVLSWPLAMIHLAVSFSSVSL